MGQLAKLKTKLKYLSNKKLNIDKVETSLYPIVRVIGWYDSTENPSIVAINTENKEVAPHCIYRTNRGDVVNAGLTKNEFSGFICEFYLTNLKSILVNNKPIEVPNLKNIVAANPHYPSFYTDDNHLSRNQIYGYGPPTDVNPEVEAFCAQLDGKLLDFGCGNGDLISKLRKKGIDIYGVELESERVNGKMKPEAIDFITMYDGQFPMPFPDNSFDYVIATEVVEHIPNVTDLPKEFARVARKGVLISVPDMTSITTGFFNGVVPWHLLEATHLNFFTSKSLSKLFSEHFVPEKFFRLGTITINGSLMPGSVGVLLKKKDL